MLLWLGAATSPSAVSKLCVTLGNGQARSRFQSCVSLQLPTPEK